MQATRAIRRHESPAASAAASDAAINVRVLCDVLAANLRAERARRRWPRAAVAQAAGLSAATIGNYERTGGRKRPDLGTIASLAKVYGLTVHQLLTEIPATPGAHRGTAANAA